MDSGSLESKERCEQAPNILIGEDDNTDKGFNSIRLADGPSEKILME